MALHLESVRDFLYPFEKKMGVWPVIASLREQSMEKSPYPADQRLVFFRIGRWSLSGRRCRHRCRNCVVLRDKRGAFDASLEN